MTRVAGLPRLRRAIISCALALLSASQTALGETTDPDALYRSGVDAARAGNWVEARAHFERAYEVSPHPRVLYNLAKVSLEMGDEAAAAAYLQQYLDTADGTTPQSEREQVRETLQALRAQLAVDETSRGDDKRVAATAADPSATPAPPMTAPPTPVKPTPVRPERARSVASKRTIPSTATLPTDDASDVRRGARSQATARSESDSSLLGPLLTGTGAGLVLSGVAVWVVADVQHGRLEKQREDLLEQESMVDATAEGFDAAVERANAIGRNDGGFEHVARMDVVAWSLAGVGVVCLGTGLWLLTTSDESVRESGVSLDRSGATFTW